MAPGARRLSESCLTPDNAAPTGALRRPPRDHACNTTSGPVPEVEKARAPSTGYFFSAFFSKNAAFMTRAAFLTPVARSCEAFSSPSAAFTS